MKHPVISAILLSSTLLGSMTSAAEPFRLSSKDIQHGQFMDKKHEFQGFGCTGEDQSPHLKWSGAPEGTESFAVFAYDPDAPTGSGWWHWQVVNIPHDVRELASNAGKVVAPMKPETGLQLKNDYGKVGFGGACPPEGHGAHRYQFTVHAMSTKLDLPENASSALVGYMVKANTIATASIEALYTR